MGRIKKLLENDLVGGTRNTDIYPVTSTKAVYNEENKNVDTILKEFENSYPKLDSNNKVEESNLPDIVKDVLVFRSGLSAATKDKAVSVIKSVKLYNVDINKSFSIWNIRKPSAGRDGNLQIVNNEDASSGYWASTTFPIGSTPDSVVKLDVKNGGSIEFVFDWDALTAGDSFSGERGDIVISKKCYIDINNNIDEELILGSTDDASDEAGSVYARINANKEAIEKQNSAFEIIDLTSDSNKKINKLIKEVRVYSDGISFPSLTFWNARRNVDGKWQLQIAYYDNIETGYFVNYESTKEENVISVYNPVRNTYCEIIVDWTALEVGSNVGDTSRTNKLSPLYMHKSEANAISVCANFFGTLNKHDTSTDMVGYELSLSGITIANELWNTTSFIPVKTDKYYSVDRTQNVYEYDNLRNFISRTLRTADKKWIPSKNTAFVRGNYLKSNQQFNIFEYTDGRQFSADCSSELKKEISPIKIKQYEEVSNSILLPNDKNFTLKFNFKLNGSLFSQNKDLFKLRCKQSSNSDISVSISNEGETTESYNRKKNTNFVINYINYNFNKLPIQFNCFGSVLFSVRINYPKVSSLNDNGQANITENMPTEYQGMKMSCKGGIFKFTNSAGSDVASFTLSDYTTIEELAFAIRKHFNDAMEVVINVGNALTSTIEDFEPITMSQEIDELNLITSSNSGTKYWDAYPCYVLSTDDGYVHTFQMNVKQNETQVTYAEVMIDGLYFTSNNDNYVPFNKDKLNIVSFAVLDSDCEISNLQITNYTPLKKPIISMQHYVEENESLTGKAYYTSTKRMKEYLDYLTSKGFKFCNTNELSDIIRSNGDVGTKIMCLTYDDYPIDIWRNTNIRKVYQQYGAKVSMFQITPYAVLKNESAPTGGAYPTKEEVHALMSAGWSINTHSATIAVNKLSYFQFVEMFRLIKDRYVKWYGIDTHLYNPHGEEPTLSQYLLAKTLGFSDISSGSAPLGYYKSAPCYLPNQAKRVSWMADDNTSFETFKKEIDNLLFSLEV